MSDMVKIGDIASLKTGPFGTQFSAKEYTDSGVPVINVKNIGYGQIIEDELEFVSEQTRDRLCDHILHTGDIVFGRKGSVDRHAYISEKYDGWVQGSDCIRLRFQPGINTRYISHFLKLDHIKKQINCASVGSTMASLNTDVLRNIEVLLPSIGVQSDVEKVLSAIEEKMEVNSAICAELESMAKTIYDYWFTQFDFPDADGKPYRSSGGEMDWNEQLKREIPKGWGNCKLKDFAISITRSTSPGEHLMGIPYTPIDEIPKRQMSFYGGLPHTEANSSLQLYQENDILIGAMRVYFHRVCIAAQQGITRSTTMVLQVRNPDDLAFVYELFNHDQTIQYATKISVGTQQPYVNWEDALDSMDVIAPAHTTISGFCKYIDPIIEKVKCLVKENHELAKLRDWLLPMLMNGQATVVDAEDEPSKVIPFVSKSDTDQRFTAWLQNQGVAARGDIDMQTMREIFDAMDDDDK